MEHIGGTRRQLNTRVLPAPVQPPSPSYRSPKHSERSFRRTGLPGFLSRRIASHGQANNDSRGTCAISTAGHSIPEYRLLTIPSSDEEGTEQGASRPPQPPHGLLHMLQPSKDREHRRREVDLATADDTAWPGMSHNERVSQCSPMPVPTNGPRPAQCIIHMLP